MRIGLSPIDRRHMRAAQFVAEVMRIVSPHLCEHGREVDAHREVSRALMDAFYQEGVEIITDAVRAQAGLSPRGPHGLTIEELHAIEKRRLEIMLAPLPPMVIPL